MARSAAREGDRVSVEDGASPSIGRRLKQLRQEHRLSIRALAQLAGVSASLISEIENDKVEPSISTLKRLAAAMSTTITYFFSEPHEANGRVVRGDSRSRIMDGANSVERRAGLDSGGVRFELASPHECESLEAIYGRYEPGATLGDEPFTHEGEEWGLILSGRLKVVVGSEIYFLEAGDSIWFPSTTPHLMENVADGVTEYIWVNTQKSF